MEYLRVQFSSRTLWWLVGVQQGVIAHRQLIDLGMHPQAIKRRLASGRLHPLRLGVYAVGRPQVTREGQWWAALLSCGPDAVLSGESAAALWGIGSRERLIDVTVPPSSAPRQPGIRVRRARLDPAHRVTRRGIAVTSPARTLLDLAARRSRDGLETAINEADKRDLIDPDELRIALESFAGLRGAPALRATLDRRTYALTEPGLERRFLPIARRAGLSLPRTQAWVTGYRVDFYWPELGLVVETDGLRYHRTPAQQARDRERDQAHTAAGLTPLRFTHAQVAFEPKRVERILREVARGLAGRSEA